jgi:hypothetical protein
MASPIAAQNGQRSVTVILETSGRDIPNFSLVERFNSVLAMYANLRVIVPEEDSTLPPVPDNRFNLDRLVEWGRESGSRYIIYLQVDSRRIATQKQWSIPLILSRYVTRGILEGAYTLVDTQRKKLVDTWNLEAIKTGPRQWQVFEDYRDDPDLHIPASQKVVFLRELEDLAVARMIENIVPNLKGR